MPRPKKNLPFGPPWSIRIHAHPFCPFPPWITKQYDLANKIHNGHIYLEMRRAVWGLPQAGILANKLLKKRLAPHGYHECKQTPGLYVRTHVRTYVRTCPQIRYGIQRKLAQAQRICESTWIVNQTFFEIKYISKSNAVNNMKLMIPSFLQPTRRECIGILIN